MTHAVENRTATIRLAEPEDYSEIHRIWMQPHIIQYMSFPAMTEEEFKPLYKRFSETSQIYVMENTDHKIVAVRRIVFGKEPENEHIASFCSMGVDQNQLKQGYASLFYKEFIALAENHTPKITRLELTQSYGNIGAFYLSDKCGFLVEARTPGWLYRERGDGGVYNLPERYVYKLLSDKDDYNINNPNMTFETKLPQLSSSQAENMQIQRKENQFYCQDTSGNLLGTCTFIPGQRVINHILFLSVSIEEKTDISLMTQFLREVVVKAKNEGFKKIEITSHDPRILPILSELGFHYRGEKQASIKTKDGYYNEVCADFGFFDIEDAKKILPTAKNLDPMGQEKIVNALTLCENAILHAFNEKEIDVFMLDYLENLAFQITEQNLCDYPLYTQENAPWNHSIQIHELPQEIQEAFISLMQSF